MTSYEAFDRLAQLRRRYDGTRSMARVAIAEAIDLAEQCVRDAELAEGARADGRIQELDRYRENEQRVLESLREQNRQLHAVLAEKRRLNEEREENGEEVQVKIGRSLGGSWLIGDLEEIVYRLRCGGATDETPVKITDYTATAKVVAPELVPLVRPSEAKVDRTPPSFAPDHALVARRTVSLPPAALVGIAVLVTAVLMVLGRVIL